MEDQFKRLVGQVARALNLSAETVADYAESDEAIKGLSKAFKDNRETLDTAGYQRAEGKIKQDVEKALKARGVEAPSFDKLTDALDQLETTAASKGGGTLSDEDVLKHPAVKRALTEAENEKMRAVDAAKKEGDEELSQKRAAFLKEQQDAQVEQKARAIIAELNPNLNPDSAKAQRQIARLVADIKNGHYKQEADGTLTPIDAEGKYLDNGAGGSKSFAEHVREVVTSEYDLPAAEKRDHVPTGTPAAAKATGIKTKEEFDEAYVKNMADPKALEKLEADYPDFAKQ
ncbi:hypothetical protein [Hymenobacter properus]|uniref:Phage protein n=1 Tax=Hymenobacter properus TaxID=2791026 RepID=A0A931BBJ1_9BACT|nr:hypothetical protein [Hymenobacter properus]MBF9140840.1 hypothetical protein [Hymenobacter properus]MBR7719649.1 hypothetical protein [Microvirga sp. SRT04]